jgi:hypothetical protein
VRRSFGVGRRKKEKNQLDQRGNTILGANRAGRNQTKRHGTNGNIFFRNFAEKDQRNRAFLISPFWLLEAFPGLNVPNI